MTKLQVRLFGPFEVSVDGEPAAGFDSDKVRALLAYLVVEAAQPHRREKLVGLLWPDYPERAARTSLRRALSNLRQVIGDRTAEPPYLFISRQTIQFNAAADAWSDAATFSALHEGQTPSVSHLEEADQVYRSSFLEGFSLPDSGAFEDWLRLTRESFQQQHLRSLSHLASYYEDLGQYERAIQFARQQIELEPYQEEAHQHLIRLLFHSGQRSQALAQYEALKETLAIELNVDPSPVSVALYEQVQSGELTQAPVDQFQSVRGYELQELLGSGHFGAVYRARQPVIGRDVAVKIILPKFADDPDFIRRFAVEAQLVARLEHPHIVPLYDYWREPGGAFLVMRWLRGGSLQQALERGPWDLGSAVQLVGQVAEALHVAHRQGVVHRDIKPANILLDEASNAYLSDFGVATLVGPLDTMGISLQEASFDDTSGSLGYLSPESIQQGPVTQATDIYSLGVVVYELLTAKHPFHGFKGQELLDKHLNETFPAIQEIRPELPPAVDEVIQKATSKDPGERYADVLEVVDALQGAIAIRPQPTPAPMEATAIQNPYKGLRPFQEADSADFFGRRGLVERLLSRMSGDEPESHFLALVGPSGSGKSSAIAAGLLPALRRGAINGSKDWFIAQMVPGPHPLDELEIALLRIAVSQPSGLMEQLCRDELGLIRAASLALPDESSELLLIIDQFEEIFTLASDPQDSLTLLQLLAAAVTEPRSQVRVLISLRADFYDRPLMHREFGQLMRVRTEVVVPMDAEEMSQAIYEPAVRAGAQLEPELMTTIVSDVGEQPGALPLLQYALTELFERRDGNYLTLEAYQEMGGVMGALGRRAEEIYQDLEQGEQETARQLLLRLVTLGEGVEDTRRRVLRSDLEALNPVTETGTVDSSPTLPLVSVLDSFGRYRLLTFDRDPITRGPTVEVAHEALLREWERLRGWLDESRDDVRQERAVSRLAEDWQQHDRDESFLLRGTRLLQVEEWCATSTLVQTHLVQEFVSHSLTQRDKEQRAEAKRKERETQLERRSRIFLRGLVAVFALAALISLGLFFFASDQRQSALDSAAEAQNVALVAGSQAALANNDTDTALALAWQAVALNPDSALAQAQLSEAAYAPGTVRILSGAKDIVFRIALSPDEKTLLGGMDDGSVILWDIETGRILWQQKVQTREEPGWVGDGVDDIAFTPDGRFVAAAYDDRIVFWHAADGQLFRQIDSLVHRQRITFNPTGEQFATTGNVDPSRLVIWDFASGEVLGEYEHGSNIEDLVYTADGSAILIARESGAVILIDARTGEILQEFQEYTGSSPASLGNIALSPDGTTVIGSGGDAGLLVWDFATGELLENYLYQFVLSAEFHPRDGSVLIGDLILLRNIDIETGAILRTNSGHDRGILSLAITADGSRAFSAGADETVRVWDMYSGQMVRRFAGPIGTSGEVAFSPDGRTVLAGSVNGTAILWDVETGEEIHRLVIDQPINAVAFSPDGRQALIGAGYEDVQEIVSGHIILWDLDTGAEIRRFEGQPYAVSSVAFSPDGRSAVSAGPGAMAILWDVETGAEIRRFEDYWVDSPWNAGGGYYDVEFSPGGKQIFTAHSDGNIIRWGVESSQDIRELVGHEIGVLGISLSSDGLWLVSGDTGSQVILWNTQTGNIRRRLDPTIGMAKPRFSPDGTLVLGSQVSGITSLLHVETGEVIRRYVGYAKRLSFSPDGLHAVIFQAGVVELWRIDSTLDELLTWTQNNRYIPELTCEQRELYKIEPLCEPEP